MAEETINSPLESPQPQEEPPQTPQPSAEITPTPLPQPELEDQPKKPKRLTLQERLALAAKKKKRQAAEGESVRESPKPEDQSAEEPKEDNERLEDEVSALNKELEKLRVRSAALTEENRQLKACISKNVESQDVLKKLADKDAVIKQLMEEGQALSAKEIKLHEKVRAMAAQNAKLENSLKEYSQKNQDTLLRLEEVENIMKTHKLKSVTQLLEMLEDNNQKLSAAQLALEVEKVKNWEAKYKESQKQYELELQEKRNANKELNELKIQLQMTQNQLALDVKLRDDTINLLKEEIWTLKEESGAEISRLESKIEALRLENEGFMKMLMLDTDSEIKSSTEAESKHIAYSEYAKLSEAHKNLQQQYVSSQKNWKLIESQLLSKLEALEELSSSLKKGNIKAQNEIRRLNSQILTLKEEGERLSQRIGELESANSDLQFQISVKEEELRDTEAKKEELTTIFNADRHNTEVQENKLKEKIESLEEQIQELRETSLGGGKSVDSFAQLQSRKLRDSGLHINMEHHNRGHSASLVPTIMEGDLLTPAAFGNSFDQSNLSHQNLLAVSLADDLESFEATEGVPAPDDELVYWRNSVDRSGIPASQGGKNIQLLSKMSGSIRRLELEVLTLKEENAKLSEEINEAQQEILEKQDLQTKLETVESELQKLQKTLDEKVERETTLLEVIGEKSERVEELKADVADLKDLCRQQVQQMIEMAEKK